MGAGLTRREFIRGGVGVASFAVLSGLRLAEPRKAHAVAGIDDLALGGLVLLVATLGGYAVSRSVANVSLSNLGYGFTDFVSDASNQAAAVTKTLADANNLGVELNRSNAEQAAASIAAGTGYFAEVMGNAASSGRVALDNFISGAGELPGVLRSLISGYIESDAFSSSGLTLRKGNYGVVANEVNGVGFETFDNFASTLGDSLPSNTTFAALVKDTYTWSLYTTTAPITSVRIVSTGGNTARFSIYSSASNVAIKYKWVSVTNGQITGNWSKWLEVSNSGGVFMNSAYEINAVTLSGDVLSAGTLPAVDRAADAPDVIGPGYDSLPLGNDLVIDPSTDDVVSAGSLPLPTGIPDVFGDFVGTLQDALAGVVPQVIGLPVSVAEPVVVGTAAGVQTMPISQAVATDTSLAASLNPPIDPDPGPEYPGTVEPPVDVPEGPWSPAVVLPFSSIWPFNMIYSFVQLFEELGGS